MASATVHRVPAESLHVSKPVWWLESRFHFSFADYFDTDRMSFGPLRVINDDLVKPRAGFGTHPHRDAEIFSYVVDGELSHADSMGNKEALGRGCVQYLSAGTGITHSEMNDGDKTCRFLQIWLSPDRRGHTPQYGSTVYRREQRHNQLLHILGGSGSVPAWPEANQSATCIRLHQDANVFVSESEPGKAYHLPLEPSRLAYLVCIEGSMQVNGEILKQRDGARVITPRDAPSTLDLVMGDNGAHFLMIEMVQPE